MRYFFRQHTYTDAPDADHELWHPKYLHAIATPRGRLATRPV